MRIDVLHIMILDKFLPPFIDFVNEHFDTTYHKFVFIGKPDYKYGLTPEHKVEWIDKKSKVFRLLRYMYKAKKIILHGLWVERLNQLLFMQPWLLKKCYWVMWGGDFYFPETQSWMKKRVIKRMGYFISSNNQDIEYLISNYGVDIKNKFYSHFYPTCISYSEDVINDNNCTKTIKILVGNSATEENRHEEVFNMLEKYKNEDIEIIVPLSYGDKSYGKKMISLGNKIFNNKFKPIVDFMNFEDYKKFLQSIDIGIFNHNRQQAGAVIKLLAGYGKKLYISKENSFYYELVSNGIKVYDIDKFNLNRIEKEVSENNKRIANKVYSLNSLINFWSAIFNFKNGGI